MALCKKFVVKFSRGDDHGWTATHTSRASYNPTFNIRDGHLTLYLEKETRVFSSGSWHDLSITEVEEEVE